MIDLHLNENWWGERPQIEGQLRLLEPAARHTDPNTSRIAAETVKPGNGDLIKAIRQYVFEHGPSTGFEIAAALEGRWGADTVRTACARAGLRKIEGGITPRGNACVLYTLQAEVVEALGELL